MRWPLRVVLDTNVVLSALLFRRGALSWLHPAWVGGELAPLATQATVAELLRVLAYPKFGLDEKDIQTVLAAYVPFAHLVRLPVAWPNVLPHCRDPDDDTYLLLAHAGQAAALVSGDRALIELRGQTRFEIITPAQLRVRLGR